MATTCPVLLSQSSLLGGRTTQADRKMCNVEEVRCSPEYSGYCLNGGVCCHTEFTVDPFCICDGEWTGRRCQNRAESSDDFFGDQGFSETTVIIIAVAVVAVCVLFAAVIFFRRNDWQTRRRNTCRLLQTTLTCAGCSAPVSLNAVTQCQCHAIDVSHRLLSTDELVTSSPTSASPSSVDDRLSADSDAGPP